MLGRPRTADTPRARAPARPSPPPALPSGSVLAKNSIGPSISQQANSRNFHPRCETPPFFKEVAARACAFAHSRDAAGGPTSPPIPASGRAREAVASRVAHAAASSPAPRRPPRPQHA
jgi:hypothetical protein